MSPDNAMQARYDAYDAMLRESNKEKTCSLFLDPSPNHTTACQSLPDDFNPERLQKRLKTAFCDAAIEHIASILPHAPTFMDEPDSGFRMVKATILAAVVEEYLRQSKELEDLYKWKRDNFEEDPLP